MIAVVTDSTADLPAEIVERLNIHVIPAILVLNGESYEDTVALSREDFYRQLPLLEDQPKTATPSHSRFQAAYQTCLDAGAEHVLSLHVASSLSGICNAAQIAARDFDKQVTVLDSGQLSLGLGFQVQVAAEAAQKGATIDEVISLVKQTQTRLHVVAMLNTLEYLRRGGRISHIKAGISALLRVRLFVELIEGKIKVLEQVRTRKKALARFSEIISALGNLEYFAILHAAAEADAMKLLQEMQTYLPKSAIIVNVNTVIGTHVGPGALGFAAVVKK